MVVNGLGMNQINFEQKPAHVTISYAHNPYGCFMGLLLTEDLAERLQVETEAQKNYAITNIFTYRHTSKVFQEVYEILSKCDVAQLQRLQNIHDSVRPENWDGALREFASTHGLTVPKMDTEEWKVNVDKLKEEFGKDY